MSFSALAGMMLATAKTDAATAPSQFNLRFMLFSSNRKTDRGCSGDFQSICRLIYWMNAGK
jgi:hypothetical protein